MARKGQVFKSFSSEFKLKAVQMYESGMSMREIAKELELPDHSYVRRWVRDHTRVGEARPKGGQRGRINLGKASSKKPELKIKWLEAEVALLKKIVAWERGHARKRSCFPSFEN